MLPLYFDAAKRMKGEIIAHAKNLHGHIISARLRRRENLNNREGQTVSTPWYRFTWRKKEFDVTLKLDYRGPL